MYLDKLDENIWAYRDIDVSGLLNKLINADGAWISYADNHNVIGDCIYVFPEGSNLDPYNEVVKIYNECLADYMNQHDLNIPLNNLDIALVEPKYNDKYMAYDQPASILFRKYKAGTTMTRHEDSIHRQYGGGFTCLFYLNGDYKGGELKFKNNNLIFKPTEGSLLIFPGHEPHEILLLEEGDRYMISAYFFKDSRPDAEYVGKHCYGSDGFEYWLDGNTLPGNAGKIRNEGYYEKPKLNGEIKMEKKTIDHSKQAPAHVLAGKYGPVVYEIYAEAEKEQNDAND